MSLITNHPVFLSRSRCVDMTSVCCQTDDFCFDFCFLGSRIKSVTSSQPPFISMSPLSQCSEHSCSSSGLSAPLCLFTQQPLDKSKHPRFPDLCLSTETLLRFSHIISHYAQTDKSLFMHPILLAVYDTKTHFLLPQLLRQFGTNIYWMASSSQGTRKLMEG